MQGKTHTNSCKYRTLRLFVLDVRKFKGFRIKKKKQLRSCCPNFFLSFLPSYRLREEKEYLWGRYCIGVTKCDDAPKILK